MCKASADENIIVVASENTDSELQTTTVAAIERIGCRALHVSLCSYPQDTLTHPFITSVLPSADFIIDLTGSFVRSSVLTECMSDLRVLVLRCKDVRELRKLVVSSGVVRRAQALERLSSSSRELKIASGAGSFLTAGLASVQCVASTGIASRKGEVAEWPSGIFRMVFNAQQVNGEAVFMPGDIFTGTGRVLSAPIHLEIENGNLVEILGDSPDANFVRSHLESESDADMAYQLTNVSLGLTLTRHHQGAVPSDQREQQAGRCSIQIGNSMALTMEKATVLFDDQFVFELGNLSGGLQPDPYEKNALGANSL